MTMILHDIGKSIAVVRGATYLQHRYTIPILEFQLRKFDFTEAEIKLALALVGHDYVGQLLTDYITFNEAKAGIKRMAKESGLSLAQFLPLQALFYSVDAGAYKRIQTEEFHRSEDGRLMPVSANFYDLMDLSKQD